MTVETTATFHSYKPGSAMAAQSLAGLVFKEAGDLVVTHVADATGTRTQLSEGTHYTIGGSGSSGAGTITALDTWPADDLFEVRRVTPRTQNTDLPDLMAVSPRAIEEELDRLAKVDQEQDDAIESAQGDATRALDLHRQLIGLPGYYATIAAALADGDLAVGDRFSSDESGELEIYERTDTDPFYAVVDGVAMRSGLNARVRFVATFAALAALNVAAGDVVLTTGYAAPFDGGGGSYLAKAATAAHPRFISATATPGVYLWLQSIENGLISVAAGGAIGTPTASHAVNHQPALQAAIDYAYAIDAKGNWLGNGLHYSVWTPLRTNAAFTGVNVDQSGVPLKFNGDKDTGLFAGSQGANLWRRSNTGVDPAVIGAWQTIPAGPNPGVWRGGMCFIRGLNAAPATRSQFTLENIKLRGGLSLDAWGGGGAFNAHGVGDGFDTTDKPVWFENDRFAPNLRFSGDCLITGFAGENVYAQGSPYQLEVTQRGRLVISESNFSGINPNGQELVQFDNLIVSKCYYVFEGAIGGSESYINIVGKDCTRAGGISGGSIGVWPPAPTRFADGALPWARLNATFQNCGDSFFPGWYLDMKIVAIDTSVKFTDAGSATILAGEMNLDLTMICDKKNQPSFLFYAPTNTAGDKKFDRVRAKVRYQRTRNAVANNFKFEYAFAYLGSFGDDCILEWIGNGNDFANGVKVGDNNHASVPDYGIKVIGDLHSQAPLMAWPTSCFWNVQTTPAVASKLPVVRLSSTNTGVYGFDLPTTNVQPGFVQAYYNFQGSTTYFVCKSGSTGGEPILIPNNGLLVVERHGNGWKILASPGVQTFTVANLPAANSAMKGVRAFVSDYLSSYDRAPVGGGAVTMGVVCNGTAWQVEERILPQVTVAALPAASAGLKGATAFVTDYLSSYDRVAVGGGAVFMGVTCNGTAWQVEERILPQVTVAALPAPNAALKGATAYVTDANAPAFGAVVAGGGAVFTKVFCNSANWIVG